MKKVFSIIICGAVVAGFTSCKNEEEDIFGESSALRLNHAVATYDDLLTSAENGWVMEYFANEEEQGYPMLVKFDKSGAVTFAAKNHYSSNDVYATEESLYEVIADNGPVLSFNSYNTLFHIFADPADNPETGTEDNPIDETGVGHEGDYEFVIYEGDADHFRMKGKKHGLEINMYKLPADQAWDTYYDKLDEIKATCLPDNINTLWLSAGDERYSITGVSDGLLNFVPEGGDPISQTVTTPFIVRLDGTVHLCSAFEGENENFAIQNFKMDENGYLVCQDENQDAFISAGSVYDLFLSNEYVWNFASFVGIMDDLYPEVAKSVTELAGNEFSEIKFIYDAKDMMPALQFLTKNGTKLNVCLTAIYENGAIKFVYDETYAPVGSEGRNGVTLLSLSEVCRNFVGEFTSQSYTVTGDAPLVLTKLTFTGATDSSQSFVIELQ